MAAPVPDDLLDVLERARALGYLGGPPLERHIRHADGFLEALGADFEPSAPVLDLGSGGGLPGLVLALRRPSWRLVLLDGAERRCRFLQEVVADLGWADRVAVACGRAEALGQDPQWRGSSAAVVARSFASPPVTAECSAPFLAPGGLLVVSEPPEPGSVERWPSDRLVELGLQLQRVVDGPFHYVVLRASRACPDRYPRRIGVPAKRPLW